MIKIEIKQVPKMTAQEVADFRAKNPEKAASVDAKMSKLKAELVAELGQEAADALMPNN